MFPEQKNPGSHFNLTINDSEGKPVDFSIDIEKSSNEQEIPQSLRDFLASHSETEDIEGDGFDDVDGGRRSSAAVVAKKGAQGVLKVTKIALTISLDVLQVASDTCVPKHFEPLVSALLESVRNNVLHQSQDTGAEDLVTISDPERINGMLPESLLNKSRELGLKSITIGNIKVDFCNMFTPPNAVVADAESSHAPNQSAQLVTHF